MRLKTETGIDPVEIAVDLDGKGAKLWLRPAETFDELKAAHNASVLLAAVLDGQVALAEVKSALGQRFDEADFTNPFWREAAAQAVTLLELTQLCALRWEGVTDEVGEVIAEPKREHLALLLREPSIANKVGKAIRRKIAIEADEGNGSAASPGGEAANPPIAPDASNQTRPVPAA